MAKKHFNYRLSYLKKEVNILRLNYLMETLNLKLSLENMMELFFKKYSTAFMVFSITYIKMKNFILLIKSRIFYKLITSSLPYKIHCMKTSKE